MRGHDASHDTQQPGTAVHIQDQQQWFSLMQQGQTFSGTSPYATWNSRDQQDCPVHTEARHGQQAIETALTSQALAMLQQDQRLAYSDTTLTGLKHAQGVTAPPAGLESCQGLAAMSYRPHSTTVSSQSAGRLAHPLHYMQKLQPETLQPAATDHVMAATIPTSVCWPLPYSHSQQTQHTQMTTAEAARIEYQAEGHVPTCPSAEQQQSDLAAAPNTVPPHQPFAGCSSAVMPQPMLSGSISQEPGQQPLYTCSKAVTASKEPLHQDGSTQMPGEQQQAAWKRMKKDAQVRM